jgi:hypothetical protein
LNVFTAIGAFVPAAGWRTVLHASRAFQTSFVMLGPVEDSIVYALASYYNYRVGIVHTNETSVSQCCVHLRCSGTCRPAGRILKQRRRQRSIQDHARGGIDVSSTLERMESLLSEQFLCRLHTTPPTLAVGKWKS